MVGQSISGPIDSVMISTSGRPVVADKSSSQPISNFHLAHTCVPVMYESSRAPNTFPIAATWTNLLRSSSDRNLPMHLN